MFLFLDFPRPDRPTLTLAGAPERVIAAHTLDEVRPALREVETAARDGYYAVGYVSYEASPAFDPALRVHSDPRLPLVWFGVLPPSAVETGTGHRRELEPSAGDVTHPYMLGKWEAMTPRADYDHAIARVHAAIARGDTYQANYTMRLHTTFAGEDVAFFRRLRAAQQPSYNAYLNIGQYRILSVSPELFIHWQEGQLTTKPMKGTVRRGYTTAEDRALAEWLATSEKNRAENVMIVDLLRNDLSRVAELGSVRVPRLFEIETYPTVFQMTSTITATPRPDLTLEELFTAMFPCGSVTGAPKVSTMRLLQELEPTPREVYCGAIGVVCPDGEVLFNVAIRTVWLDIEEGTAEYGVGGGITWDSVAAAEYDEALAKAAVLGATAPDFELLETLRLENGDYFLLEHHLARLAESAAYFGFAWDEGAVRERLNAESRKQKAENDERRNTETQRNGDTEDGKQKAESGKQDVENRLISPDPLGWGETTTHPLTPSREGEPTPRAHGASPDPLGRGDTENGKMHGRGGSGHDDTSNMHPLTRPPLGTHPKKGSYRVRLLLSKDGTIRTESTRLDTPFVPFRAVEGGGDADVPRPEGTGLPGKVDAGDILLSAFRLLRPVVLHATPTFHHNRFLYHKTTHRVLYEQARAAHPDAWDVLLWNEAGELMEFTIGNVVLELEGQRYTPPVSSGLLPGTFRADLLERGELQERVLRVEDLERAERVWLINSVRGWVEVEVVKDER